MLFRSPDTLKRLSAIPNIVAVKECNLNQVAETRLLCGDDLTIFSGEDGNVVSLMALGGKGVISVIANIIPSDIHKMVKLFQEGNLKESSQMQIDIANLVNALFCEVNPIPVKAAMNLMGMNIGQCRMPLVEISDKGLKILQTALTEYGLI